MKLYTIGKNIKLIRLQRKMRQEDLAEKVGISTNYIGAIERGEKIPALETLLSIINTLNVSSNVILRDVINEDYDVKTSLLSEKIEKLSKSEKELIFATIETMINQMRNKN